MGTTESTLNDPSAEVQDPVQNATPVKVTLTTPSKTATATALATASASATATAPRIPRSEPLPHSHSHSPRNPTTTTSIGSITPSQHHSTTNPIASNSNSNSNSNSHNSKANLNINAFSKTTQRSNTNLNAMPIDMDAITSLSSSLSSSSIATSLSPILSNENIKAAFNVATFGPQILWVFMIFLPNTQITKKLMGSYAPIVAFSLVHLFIVIASASQDNGTAPLAEFNDVFDPSGDPQQAMMGMMKYPNFVSEEWSHVLTWDLFVGRMIWLDGLKRGVFTGHSVLFCNLIGPPGFLMHVATCLITGKGLVGNEAEDLEKEEE